MNNSSREDNNPVGGHGPLSSGQRGLQAIFQWGARVSSASMLPGEQGDNKILKKINKKSHIFTKYSNLKKYLQRTLTYC